MGCPIHVRVIPYAYGTKYAYCTEHEQRIREVEMGCHGKIGPGKTGPAGPILDAKTGLAGPLLVTKIGPT